MTASPISTPALPHAAPFRLLDRVIAADLERGSLRAIRRLTAADALWPAELPTTPTATNALHFPDSLVIESLCQAAASLNAMSAVAQPGKAPQHRGYLVSISDFRFAAPELRARIGETLILEVLRGEKLGSVVAFTARALATADPVAASGEQAAGSSREVASGRLLFAVSYA